MSFLRVDALWPAVAAAVNRHETGQKTTNYGGVRRARWSSQSQKRPTRLAFRDRLDERNTAMRTRRWEPIAEHLTAAGWNARDAEQAALHVYTLLTGGDGSAMVLVRSDFAQIAAQAILDHAEAVHDAVALTLKKPGKDAEDDQRALWDRYADRQKALKSRLADKDAKREHEEALAAIIDTILDATHNVDIAFNGRMIAKNTAFNVDAAVHVAHAVSVDPWDEANLDYFTAIDDYTGTSGMNGTRPNGTVLFHRTATVDLGRAHATLGGDMADIVDYAVLWADMFCRAVPTSMQSSTMATSAPILAAVTATEAAPPNLNPFCAEPITGRYQHPTAAARLLDYHQTVTNGFAGAARMHYWSSLDLQREADSDQAHATWETALGAAAADLHQLTGARAGE